MMGKSRRVNPVKVGDVFTSNQGYKMTVVEYNNASDVVVEFEDGVRRTTRADCLRLGTVKKPENRVGHNFTTNSGWRGVVVEYNGATDVKVRFECGEERVVTWANIMKGGIKPRNQPSVYGKGFIGVGEFVPKPLLNSVGGKPIPEESYRTWIQILKRIYSTNKHDKRNRGRYGGVSVAEEWHNLQNFCEWSVQQVGYNLKDENGRAWCIDKDILIEGNMEYKPEACVYVPNKLNVFFSIQGGGKCLYGVDRITPREEHFKVGYTPTVCNHIIGKTEYLGFYETQEEAHELYVKRKNEIARELAKHYKGVVDYKVIEALNNFDIKRRLAIKEGE